MKMCLNTFMMVLYVCNNIQNYKIKHHTEKNEAIASYMQHIISHLFLFSAINKSTRLDQA